MSLRAAAVVLLASIAPARAGYHMRDPAPEYDVAILVVGRSGEAAKELAERLYERAPPSRGKLLQIPHAWTFDVLDPGREVPGENLTGPVVPVRMHVDVVDGEPDIAKRPIFGDAVLHLVSAPTPETVAAIYNLRSAFVGLVPTRWDGKTFSGYEPAQPPVEMVALTTDGSPGDTALRLQLSPPQVVLASTPDQLSRAIDALLDRTLRAYRERRTGRVEPPGNLRVLVRHGPRDPAHALTLKVVRTGSDIVDAEPVRERRLVTYTPRVAPPFAVPVKALVEQD